MEQYLKQGLVSDSKVLDIRQVDVRVARMSHPIRSSSLSLFLVAQISMGKILENNIAVFVVTFATQEMLLFRNAKTREAIIGSEQNIEQCHYAAVITRAQEELDNELTGGWKVIEVCTISSMISMHSLFRILGCVLTGDFLCRWVEDLLAHTYRLVLAHLSSRITH